VSYTEKKQKLDYYSIYIKGFRFVLSELFRF